MGELSYKNKHQTSSGRCCKYCRKHGTRYIHKQDLWLFADSSTETECLQSRKPLPSPTWRHYRLKVTGVRSTLITPCHTKCCAPWCNVYSAQLSNQIILTALSRDRWWQWIPVCIHCQWMNKVCIHWWWSVVSAIFGQRQHLYGAYTNKMTVMVPSEYEWEYMLLSTVHEHVVYVENYAWGKWVIINTSSCPSKFDAIYYIVDVKVFC
jgi:hypothetical protein